MLHLPFSLWTPKDVQHPETIIYETTITSPSQQLCADLKYFTTAAYRFLRGSGRLSHMILRTAKMPTDKR